jgi:hypothetical protein
VYAAVNTFDAMSMKWLMPALWSALTRTSTTRFSPMTVHISASVMGLIATL